MTRPAPGQTDHTAAVTGGQRPATLAEQPTEAPLWPIGPPGTPGGSAALAAEGAAVHGRPMSAVNFPGVLAPGRAGDAGFPGPLALQGLAEFGLRLVRGGDFAPLIRFVAGLGLAGGGCLIR